MCDVTENYVQLKKKSCLQIDKALVCSCELESKRQTMELKHTDYLVMDEFTVVCKNGPHDILLGYERTNYVWFS